LTSLVSYRIRQAISLPFIEVIKRGMRLIIQQVSNLHHRIIDRYRPTFSSGHIKAPLHRYFSGYDMELLPDWLPAVCCHYLAHRFDLLGSGWVQVRHGMQCRGMEGYQYNMSHGAVVDNGEGWLSGRINAGNLIESRRIWSIVDADYMPIDWHIDFKSGYRWDDIAWYKDISFGRLPGVDIKVPWELSRMQHLVQFSRAYSGAKNGMPGYENAEQYIFEFRNQILDFIATNPPRYGVNWSCTMDVAIRVVNWLVAYDIFRVSGASFDQTFEGVFKRSIYEHGEYIINHLEWSPEFCGNHYLSDIIGLIFVAAYLPRTPEIDVWLAFSVQELIKEVGKQFYSDGANFEASTCYHRLSAEMVVYATALVMGLPEDKIVALETYDSQRHQVRPHLKPAPITFSPVPGSVRESPFPVWYFEKLEKMAEFTMQITKPDGHIPQVGDNDSGRFLKLDPVYHYLSISEAMDRYDNLKDYGESQSGADYWDEDHLDHRHLVAAINGLYHRGDFMAFTGSYLQETKFISKLCGGIQVDSYCASDKPVASLQRNVGSPQTWVHLETKLNTLPDRQRQVISIPYTGTDLLDGLSACSYPEFGLYIFRSRSLYLAVRCGPVGQNGNGGHAHNDQLAIELNIDGKDWITDPGTYVYTPLPEQRNIYRSVNAHFAPRVGEVEPAELHVGYGLFRLAEKTNATCLYFGDCGFIGKHTGYGAPVYRMVEVRKNAIIITDAVLKGELKKTNQCGALYASIPISRGYGLKERRD